MSKKKRLTDQDVVEKIINYLNNHEGIVTRGEMCSNLKISAKTCDKWLLLFQLIKTQCPDYKYEKTGKTTVIFRPYFTGTHEEKLSKIHNFLSYRGIEISELRKEIAVTLVKSLETTGTVQEPLISRVSPSTMIELKQELSEAVAKGIKGLIPINSSQVRLETDISPSTLVELKKELSEAVTRGVKALAPVVQDDRIKIPQQTDFEAELAEAISRGVKGLEPVDPRKLEPDSRENAVLALKKELAEAISKGIDGLIHVESEKESIEDESQSSS
ncbi:MAG: hypothetical protein ACTSRU_21595 [Candidatus Hodarchaeales archaeon]